MVINMKTAVNRLFFFLEKNKQKNKVGNTEVTCKVSAIQVLKTIKANFRKKRENKTETAGLTSQG